MFYLVKVLIGRSVLALDRLFSYYTLDKDIKAGERVLVPFGKSKETIGFVMEEPIEIDKTIQEYQEENGIKGLSKIIRCIDSTPLLDENLRTLAKQVSDYYKADLIKVLSSFLPPSLKPHDSALKKTQAKTVSYLFSLPFDDATLSRNEKNLYLKIQAEKDGLRKSDITAKASLTSLLEKKAVEIREIQVSRIPELTAKKYREVTLTLHQKEVYDKVIQTDKETFLLQGVTGSGKTEVYLKLVEYYLRQNKGCIVLLPEITLTDHMADVFYSHFKDTISILNSSLSDGRKYDEYQRIASGESKVVLGTRSAIFAPVKDLGLIIIDEEHSSSYKQDTVPFYDAIKVSQLRAANEHAKVLLGSATPRIIDKARAMKGLYEPLFLKERFAAYQDKDTKIVDMNVSANLNLRLSSLYSTELIRELQQNLERKEQSMILLNRRGYSPIYLCRKCQHVIRCPNCNIPLNYHKNQRALCCHHCGYRLSTDNLTCPDCHGHDFLELGYGTERAYDELKMLFPTARILRLDSDVTSNDRRHQILQDFQSGDSDIMIGTQVIAKGLDFPKVTLASILDADFTLRLPTYMADEETFDLISQFVGRAGRSDKKGKVLLQTFVPDNKVIQMAMEQDYDSFYTYEMEERRKYQYPPYTYLAMIVIKAIDQKTCIQAADSLFTYLNDSIKNLRVNLYGPSIPYIPYQNGRYYRNILLKYKSIQEISPVLDGIKVIRMANKDAEILVNVDPGKESL